MKISTKGRYALRLMLSLAEAYPDKYVTIKTISEQEGISNKYLEQIISTLKKAGMVNGVRGPQGGYKLVDSPDKVFVGEIMRATEGSIAPVPCMENMGECLQKESCSASGFWKKIDDSVKNIVNTTSLACILEENNQK